VRALVPPVARFTAEQESLRGQVRTFLAEQLAAGRFEPRCDSWLGGFDPEFSRELGRRGWLGMTVPREYGGQGRAALDRYVVTEELLAAGAPVTAHWVADRQIAPSLLRYGSEELRRRWLPRIAAGESYWAIGLSEPDAGSDLAAVRTRAVRVDGGWELTGTKVWTSGAHRAHAFFVLARSAPAEGRDRHAGLSQFLVELDQPGIGIRPIRLLTGEHHFNEVVLSQVYVPDEHVMGTIGNGWAQVTAELAYERSGPERLLSTYPLLNALVLELSAAEPPPTELGLLLARVWAVRQLSAAVAASLDRGEVPEVSAALVKDVGTRLENAIIDAARLLVRTEPDPSAPPGTGLLLAQAVLHAPGFTLRGGTNEILRGVVARALGVR
jgi:alkylation response protein AidB-like acyl-CoA dehydrogenase